jgi:hypothetical protein
MLLLRLFLTLAALLIAVSGGMYLFTRKRQYLSFAWQTVRLIVLVLLIFAALFVLERYTLIGWRILV